MSGQTWFTGDHHFGHAKIIEYCRRPFDSVRIMDERLVALWNETVGSRDTVYHLGDFAFGRGADVSALLGRLNGTKHLIEGNHDHTGTIDARGWASRRQLSVVMVDGTQIVLCHYALRTWPSSHRGTLHFYGHSHGGLPGDNQSCDVGVDVWDYCPVSLKQIRGRLALSSPRNHQAAAEPVGMVR